MVIAVASAAATLILPISTVATGVSVYLIGQVFTSLERPKRIRSEGQAASRLGRTSGTTPSSITSNFQYYREMELQRVVAALKANSPILVTGDRGSGKYTLRTAVVEQLSEEGFTIAFVEPTTPKQMLVEIAEQLNVDTHNSEGKALTVEGLKKALATFFENNTAFLVVDDAHTCEPKFRIWLKSLKRQGVPMLLLATNPPKSDVFINLPRIELAVLPERISQTSRSNPRKPNASVARLR